MAQKKEQPENFLQQLLNRLNQPSGNNFSLSTDQLSERLRRLSRRYMQRERAGYTVQPTKMVHEVYAQLKRQPGKFKDAQNFYATDAQQMHQVLVEHARYRQLKRVKSDPRTNDEALASPDEIRSDQTVLELHDALLALEKRDAEAFRACELHYFAGLTLPEIAIVMGLNQATVAHRLRFAKAWIRNQIDRLSKLPEGSHDPTKRLFREGDPHR